VFSDVLSFGTIRGFFYHRVLTDGMKKKEEEKIHLKLKATDLIPSFIMMPKTKSTKKSSSIPPLHISLSLTLI